MLLLLISSKYLMLFFNLYIFTCIYISHIIFVDVIIYYSAVNFFLNFVEFDYIHCFVNLYYQFI